MKSLPNHIPPSLKSYPEQFRKDPEKTIERLEKHLKKRGPDAVGYYLLSWFYHFRKDRKKAIQTAWKAKLYAPGSPVMEQLHYFMAHPESFNAWRPSSPVARHRSARPANRVVHPILDLDSLIDKLSSVEKTRIEFKPDSETGPNLAEASAMVDDIVTETLALIHEKQENLDDAILTYRKLIELNGERADYYRGKIRELEKRNDSES